MAKSIGKVVVSIEARVEALEQGMAKAEATVRKSSAKIESNQKSLTNKIGKSWTEFANKLRVIQQVAMIADKAISMLGEAAVIWGNESASTMDKYNATLDALQNSGIPVLSQAVSIGTTLRSVLDGSAQELARLNELMVRLGEISNRLDLDLVSAKGARALEDIAERWEDLTRMQWKSEDDNFFDRLEAKQIELAHKRIDLEKSLKSNLVKFSRTADADLARESMERSLASFDAQTEYILRGLLERREEELQTIEDVKQAKIKAADDAAKREEELNREIAQKVQNQTDVLQTKLTQLTLEDLGLDLVSKLVDIHARFNLLRKTANEEQISLLNEIEAIELRRARNAHAETEARKADLQNQKVDRDTAADQTKLEDLTTAVTVATLEAAGEKLAAQLVRIEARFKKMRKGATDEQLAQIAKLEKLEKQKIRDADAPVRREDKTETFQTAIGSFTVAADRTALMGERQAGLLETISKTPELLAKIEKDEEGKKQSSLLSKIAKSSERTANAITSNSTTGSAIIPAG